MQQVSQQPPQRKPRSPLPPLAYTHTHMTIYNTQAPSTYPADADATRTNWASCAAQAAGSCGHTRLNGGHPYQGGTSWP